MSEEVLKGWIKPLTGEINVMVYVRELKALGIEVGSWDLHDEEFKGCVVPVPALTKLDPMWGSKYIWGLA